MVIDANSGDVSGQSRGAFRLKKDQRFGSLLRRGLERRRVGQRKELTGIVRDFRETPSCPCSRAQHAQCCPSAHGRIVESERQDLARELRAQSLDRGRIEAPFEINVAFLEVGSVEEFALV